MQARCSGTPPFAARFSDFVNVLMICLCIRRTLRPLRLRDQLTFTWICFGLTSSDFGRATVRTPSL